MRTAERRIFPPPANPHHDTAALRLLGLRKRTVKTLRGEFEFCRTVWECPKTRRQVAPLDQEIGLSHGAKMTREVISKVAWAGARSAYTGAAEDLCRLAGIEVSRAEFARVVLEEGERVGTLRQEREERWSEPVKSDRPVFAAEHQCERLVVEADATAVLTVAEEEHKMVYCARAYDAVDRYEKGGREMIAGESRFAAGGETIEEFKYSVDALANRMGARSAVAVAFLADGAPCLWKMASERLPHAVQIQDFWHVCEHLFGLARILHGERSREAKAVGERWKAELWEGKVEEILAELQQLHKKHRGEKRKKIGDKIRYLKEGKHRMEYPRYRDEGWPIGSGAVEATCKHLIKERLCVTGARWRRENIPHAVSLRLCRANGEWDTDFPPTAESA